ncbi:MAG: hypothetical protein AAF594_16230 [Bacteroidota bacterium]
MRRAYGTSRYGSERDRARRLRADDRCESCGHPARYPGERFCGPCLAHHTAARVQRPVTDRPEVAGS